ncbi:hypothetical protein [Massilia frigida]|uniref:hypothetical protein n=1 Tax=Massilia frigida TaxID=2609281 RepID=UPI001421F2D9|nr:hypothetical protein [Massilia frigida]
MDQEVNVDGVHPERWLSHCNPSVLYLHFDLLSALGGYHESTNKANLAAMLGMFSM